MSNLKFVHFKCRNTKKLDLVSEKLKDLEDVKVVQLGFKELLFYFLIHPFSLFKPGKKKVYNYYKNNYLKTTIRLPELFAFWPVSALYQFSFEIKARLTYQYLESFFKHNEKTFDVVLLWGGSYLPQTIIKELCLLFDKKTLYFEVSSLPEKIQVDPNGVNYNSSLNKTADFYKSLKFNENEPLPSSIGKRASKLNHKKQIQKLPENYIFVPLQVPSDSQILDFSPWVKDMVHLYEILEEAIKDYDRYDFVIKEHPSFKISIQPMVTAHSKIHFANSYETKELIEKSQAVVTINSSVGLEGLILSKKVVVLGEVNYDIDGLVQRARSVEQLVDVLKSLNHWNFDENLRQSFLRYFYNRFLVAGSYDKLNREVLAEALKKIKVD